MSIREALAEAMRPEYEADRGWPRCNPDSPDLWPYGYDAKKG